MFDRRAMTVGLLGAGLVPAGATAASGVVEGQPTWSESAMVLCFDPELRNGFSLRISRYPERNATWVWCHLLVDGVLYAFTERAVPCGPERTSPDAPVAVYAAPGLKVRIIRLGPSADLRALSFSAEVKAHKGRSGVDGAGETPIALEGVFRPGALHAGSPDGRFERNGTVQATLLAGSKSVTLAGIGKAHEQSRTNPRFFAPFTYAMLWGPTASLIGMMSPQRRYGDFEVDGKDTGVDNFKIEPWAERRRFAALLKDGRRIEGSAQTVHHYEAPIFGQRWLGRIVKADVDGRSMVGMINDWRPERQPYGLA